MLAVALVLFAVGSGEASASTHRVRVSAQLPGVVRVGESVTISGKAARAPAGSIAELQQRQITGGRWQRLTSVRVHGGAFTLRWQAQSSQQRRLINIRVVIAHRGAILAHTPVRSLLVGPAPEYCAPPNVPTSLPPGDGVIVGGLYTLGGPAPGIDACRSTPYTITLADAAGAVVLTQPVPGGQSYALVVPAGSYTLSDEFCRGQATVTAGKVTEADTDCDVP